MTFANKLMSISYATVDQQKNELWDIAGILKNRLNIKYKFDTRPITKQGDSFGKTGNTKSKADKMVFKIKENYMIVDVEELHSYIKKNNIKTVYLNDLIDQLEWNIFI